MNQPRRIGLVLVVLGALLSAPGTGQAKAPATTSRAAPYRRVVRFKVSYAGSGSYWTRYHSHPPNQGGKPDTDTAHDSSTQRWSLTFGTLLTFPRCAPSLGASDPCRKIAPISGARGATAVTGRVSHVHLDGLFKDENASAHCLMHAATPAGVRLNATLDVHYDPGSRAISVTALDPVADAMNLLPGQCPNQGDPLDGLAGEYFGPAFSFNPAYDPQRWFTSRTVVIPISKLRRAARIRIVVAQTRAGTPPRGCDVPAPSYEHCTTTGRWRGVLTFVARR